MFPIDKMQFMFLVEKKLSKSLDAIFFKAEGKDKQEIVLKDGTAVRTRKDGEWIYEVN
jgi:hypothetical protein